MRHRFRGDSRRIFADEINKWNRLADQQARGELRKIPTVGLESYDPSSRIARVKNTSGSDRSAFDCMSIDGLSWDLETTGESDVLFNLITADPDKAPAVLIEPIANGAIGRAVLDGLAIAKVGGGSGLTGTPDATNHRIAPGAGSIKLLSAPHASTVRLLPVVLNAGGEGGTSNYAMRLGFIGRDSANAFKWNSSMGSDGFIDFSGYIGTHETTYGANLAATELGITVVSHTGGGVPANAERLHFTKKGRYRINLAWLVGSNGSGVILQSESYAYPVSGGSSAGSRRKITPAGTASVSGYYAWIQDTRLFEVTGTTSDLVISIAAANGLADPPAIGQVIIESV
jgi:hypothetical protein